MQGKDLLYISQFSKNYLTYSPIDLMQSASNDNLIFN